jgi:hypothetical protein
LLGLFHPEDGNDTFSEMSTDFHQTRGIITQNSSDLNFICGYLKNLVYASAVDIAEELLWHIQNALVLYHNTPGTFLHTAYVAVKHQLFLVIY